MPRFHRPLHVGWPACSIRSSPNPHMPCQAEVWLSHAETCWKVSEPECGQELLEDVPLN